MIASLSLVQHSRVAISSFRQTARRSPRALVRTFASMDSVKSTIGSAPVVVFSKTYCPCVATCACGRARTRGPRVCLTAPQTWCVDCLTLCPHPRCPVLPEQLLHRS